MNEVNTKIGCEPKRFKPTPMNNRYELEFKYIREREKLIKYINQLIEKIEERITLLEAQQRQ